MLLYVSFLCLLSQFLKVFALFFCFTLLLCSSALLLCFAVLALLFCFGFLLCSIALLFLLCSFCFALLLCSFTLLSFLYSLGLLFEICPFRFAPFVLHLCFVLLLCFFALLFCFALSDLHLTMYLFCFWHHFRVFDLIFLISNVFITIFLHPRGPSEKIVESSLLLQFFEFR